MHNRFISRLSILLVLLMAAPTIAAAQAWTPGGKLTYYGGSSAGACGFGPIPTATVPFDYYAAVGADLWDDSNGCGRFIEIDTADACGTPPGCTNDSLLLGNKITVMVADHCPGCVSGHLDLSPAAMDALVQPGTKGTVGVIGDVDWRYVHGNFPGNIRIKSLSGTSSFWFSMIVMDHNEAITKAEMRSSGSSTWFEFDRNSVNQFIMPVGMPTPLVLPVSIRLTGENAEVLQLVDVVGSFAGDTDSDMGAQFSAPPPSVPIPPSVGWALAGALSLTGVYRAARRRAALRRAPGVE